MWRRVASPHLVGREHELAELGSALRRAEAGEPAMVLVSGEAGIGKTRLVRQFTDTVPKRVWIGHCPPVGEGLLPYAPIIEVLRAAVDDLGAQTVCERVGSMWPKLTRLLPEFSDPPAGPPPLENSQAAQWAELVWLLNRLTDEPTVIVVEDLHWADSSTRGLLNLLVRGATGRLLLICTYRDDELPPAHPLRSALAEWRRTGMERIALARLDRDEVLSQVRAITYGGPCPLEIDELYRRSDGNPFFVEELLAAGPDAAALPEGLRDLLLLRVRQLPDAARQAVGVVALVGHGAGHGLLTSVLRIGADELSAGLGSAMDSHIIVTTGDTYALRHVLVGEAVVAEMLPGERMRLHGRIAEALDALSGKGTTSALPAETAHHWLAAGEPDRALVSAIAAGLAAENTFALPEAHGHFQTALGLWEHAGHAHHLAGLDLVGLYQHAAETAYLLDDLETALTLVRQGLERADPVADPLRVGLMHERQGRYMLASGKPTHVTLEAYQKAVDLVPDEPTTERARVLAGFSAMVLGAARHDEAASWARRVVDTARRAGARREEARGLSTLGCSLVMLGRQDEGIARLRKALGVATEIRDPVIQLSSYINLSDALHNVGRFADAADVALRGVEVFEGDTFQRGLYLCLLGNALEALFWRGRWDELAVWLPGIEHPDDTKTMHLNLWRAATEYFTATGRFEEAESTMDVCRRAEGSAHLESTGQMHATLAELHLWRGQPRAAWDNVRQALDLLGEDCSHGPLVARLLASGARALADLAASSSFPPGRPIEPALSTPRHLTEPASSGNGHPADDVAWLAGRIAWLPKSLRLTSLAEAHLSQAQAELARLGHDPASPPENTAPPNRDPASAPENTTPAPLGRDAATAWERTAELWRNLDAVPSTAYAQWRQAEAMLSTGAGRQAAEAPLAQSHSAATALGADPLRREIEALAKRARVDLQSQPADRMATPFGLTARELDVLTVLAKGQTNRQIAKRLFISEKTVSIHVSRILAKLDVPNRAAAVATAHRLGLG